MDYCEWRNGYRTEAMTAVAKGLAVKFGKLLTNLFNLQVKKWIGYDQTLYSKGIMQTNRTQFYLFMSATLLPLFSSMLSVIPMFFWNLNKTKREQMYAELLERRAGMAAAAADADAATMDELAKEQLNISQVNKGRKL